MIFASQRRALLSVYNRLLTPKSTAATNKCAVRRVRAGLIGLSAGGCTGFLGWGAAQVIIPGGAWMGCTPLQASAASLSTLAVITLGSGFRFWQADQADLVIAVSMGLPALICAPLGVYCARSVSARALQIGFNTMTTVLVPIQILAVARKMKLGSSDHADSAPLLAGEATSWQADHPWSLLALTSTFGAALGWTCGFMGVAGLPFVVTYLTVATELPHHVIIGTTFASVTPTVLAAVASHLHAKTAPVALLPPLLGSAGVGCLAGATLGLYTPPEILQLLFILTLVAAGTRSGLTLNRLLASTPRLSKG
jgi:uncharacterized membrane protein YfcA